MGFVHFAEQAPPQVSEVREILNVEAVIVSSTRSVVRLHPLNSASSDPVVLESVIEIESAPFS